MSDNKQLTIVERQTEEMGIIAPEAMKAARDYADTILKSGFVPDHYKKMGDKAGDAVIIALQYGSQVGFRGITALQNISVINGMPSLKGDACSALIQGSGEVEAWEERYEGEPYADNFRHVIVCKRRGRAETKYEFSVADAKRAKLWITEEDVKKDYKKQYKPWYTYPKRMLRYRNLGFLSRDVFPDLMQGFVIDAEAQDMPIHAQPEVEVQDASGNPVSIKKKAGSSATDSVSEGLDKKASKKEPDVDVEEVEEVEVVDDKIKEKEYPLTPNEAFDSQGPSESKDEPVPAEYDPEIDEEGLKWDPEWKVYKEVELTNMGPVKALTPILEERGLLSLFEEAEGKKTNKKARTLIIKHQEMTEPLRNEVPEPQEESEEEHSEEAPTEVPSNFMDTSDLNVDPRIAEAGEPGEEGRAFPAVKIIWDVFNNIGINEMKAKEIMAEMNLDFTNKEMLCTKATLEQLSEVLQKAEA